MKKPIVMGAIALVIAGLMITSVAGLPLGSLLAPEDLNVEEEKTENASIGDISEIVEALQGGLLLRDLEIKEGVTKSKITASSSKLKRQSAGAIQTISTPVESIALEAKSFQPAKYTLEARHPALAGYPQTTIPDTGNLIIGYDVHYVDPDVPEEFEELPWDGSPDYGQSWSGGIVFIDELGNPIKYKYPSVDYWGKNGSIDRFVGTCEGDPAYRDGAETLLIQFEDTEDMLNGTTGRVWDWSTHPTADLYRFKKADIAADNTIADWNLGRIALLITRDEPPAQSVGVPALFLQTNESYGSLWSYSNAVDGTAASAYKDKETPMGYMMWDFRNTVASGTPPNPTTNWDMLAGRYNFSDTDINGDNEAWTWYYADENVHTRHPAIAANDDCIIAAVEFINDSETPQSPQIHFEIVLFEDGTTGGYRGGWLWSVDNISDYPIGVGMVYPEIAHVEGDTFVAMCTFHDYLTDDTELLMTVTYNRGENWTELYSWSDDVIESEYRNVDISDLGAMVAWEYQREQEAKVFDVVIHYTFNTVTLYGYTFYEEGDPAPLGVVELTNLDTGREYLPGFIGNFYHKRLILGNETILFDIGIDTTLEIYAEDDTTVNKNTSQHTFTNETLALFMMWNLTLRPDEQEYLCGDLNNDEVINLGDVVYLINYLYRGGDPPDPECVGDINNDDVVNLGDVVYLINYLYRGGDPPSPDCCD